METINFFSEDTDFQLSSPKSANLWIKNSIQEEGKKCGDLNIIFCSDTFLLNLNIDYLNHDTYTDIITFDWSENQTISGELYISIERVKENAILLRKTFEEELNRVMIHGVLHLMGYADKSPSDLSTMRAKEDFYLALQP